MNKSVVCHLKDFYFIKYCNTQGVLDPILVIIFWDIMKWIFLSGCQYNCVVRSLENGAGGENSKEQGKELEEIIQRRYDGSLLLVKVFLKPRAVIISQNLWDKSNRKRMLVIMLDMQEYV